MPLGVGAHLAYWGVPEARIVELDWWEQAGSASWSRRHAGAPRLGPRRSTSDATLWAGFALVGREHRAYYSGDTGLFPALARDRRSGSGPSTSR